MKISDRTIDILKNFSTINNAINIKAGNAIFSEPQRAGDDGKIYAFATLTDTFPSDFAIFDISEFLSIISSLGKETEIVFNENNSITLTEGNSKVNYTLGNPAYLNPPRKMINKPSFLSFKINKDTLSKKLRLSSIIGANIMYVRKENDKLSIICTNDQSISFNDYVLEIEEYNLEDEETLSGDFNVGISLSLIQRVLNEGYDINIHDNYLTLTTETKDLVYAIPYANNTKKGF